MSLAEKLGILNKSEVDKMDVESHNRYVDKMVEYFQSQEGLGDDPADRMDLNQMTGVEVKGFPDELVGGVREALHEVTYDLGLNESSPATWKCLPKDMMVVTSQEKEAMEPGPQKDHALAIDWEDLCDHNLTSEVQKKAFKDRARTEIRKYIQNVKNLGGERGSGLSVEQSFVAHKLGEAQIAAWDRAYKLMDICSGDKGYMKDEYTAKEDAAKQGYGSNEVELFMASFKEHKDSSLHDNESKRKATHFLAKAYIHDIMGNPTYQVEVPKEIRRECEEKAIASVAKCIEKGEITSKGNGAEFERILDGYQADPKRDSQMNLTEYGKYLYNDVMTDSKTKQGIQKGDEKYAVQNAAPFVQKANSMLAKKNQER